MKAHGRYTALGTPASMVTAALCSSLAARAAAESCYACESLCRAVCGCRESTRTLTSASRASHASTRRCCVLGTIILHSSRTSYCAGLGEAAGAGPCWVPLGTRAPACGCRTRHGPHPSTSGSASPVEQSPSRCMRGPSQAFKRTSARARMRRKVQAPKDNNHGASAASARRRGTSAPLHTPRATGEPQAHPHRLRMLVLIVIWRRRGSAAAAAIAPGLSGALVLWYIRAHCLVPVPVLTISPDS